MTSKICLVIRFWLGLLEFGLLFMVVMVFLEDTCILFYEVFRCFSTSKWIVVEKEWLESK